MAPAPERLTVTDKLPAASLAEYVAALNCTVSKTAVTCVAELFDVSGSYSFPTTLTVLARFPPPGGLIVTVTVAEAPALRLRRLQVTVSANLLQGPEPDVAETKVTFAGRRSATTNPVAAVAALFVTWIV